MQLVRGKTDRRKITSVLGPSGRMYAGVVCCGTMPPASRLRLRFIWMVEQRWFDNITLTVIVVNSLVLAVQGPPDNPDSPIPKALAPAVELTFTIIFTIEMLIKVVAMGLFCHRARTHAARL